MHSPAPIVFHITCRWPDLRPVSMATSGLEGGPARWTPENSSSTGPVLAADPPPAVDSKPPLPPLPP